MSDENREGLTGRGKWWFASVIVVVLVVLGLLAIFLLPDHNKDAGTDQPTTTPTTSGDTPSSPAASTPAASGSGWSAAGCNGNPGGDQVPTTAPEATWAPIGGSAVPTSTTYGPTKTTGAVRQCFQHSPTGALFAASTVTTSVGAAPDQATAIIRAGVAPGPGRDQMLSEASGSSDGFSQTVAAYRFGACAPDRCNVDLVFSVNGGQLAQTTLTVVWSANDWLLDATASQNQGTSQVAQIPAGFTSWAPGR